MPLLSLSAPPSDDRIHGFLVACPTGVMAEIARGRGKERKRSKRSEEERNRCRRF